eukprot:scaffold3993_cov101-Isochrysis_galbana.AAC.2
MARAVAAAAHLVTGLERVGPHGSDERALLGGGCLDGQWRKARLLAGAVAVAADALVRHLQLLDVLVDVGFPLGRVVRPLDDVAQAAGAEDHRALRAPQRLEEAAAPRGVALGAHVARPVVLERPALAISQVGDIWHASVVALADEDVLALREQQRDPSLLAPAPVQLPFLGGQLRWAGVARPCQPQRLPPVERLAEDRALSDDGAEASELVREERAHRVVQRHRLEGALVGHVLFEPGAIAVSQHAQAAAAEGVAGGGRDGAGHDVVAGGARGRLAQLVQLGGGRRPRLARGRSEKLGQLVLHGVGLDVPSDGADAHPADGATAGSAGARLPEAGQAERVAALRGARLVRHRRADGALEAAEQFFEEGWGELPHHWRRERRGGGEAVGELGSEHRELVAHRQLQLGPQLRTHRGHRPHATRPTRAGLDRRGSSVGAGRSRRLAPLALGGRLRVRR